MPLVRLDKILTDTGLCSRSQAREIIRRGRAAVNGIPCADPAEKFDPDTVSLTVDGEPIDGPGHIYIMLNKPQGVVSAREDKRDVTVTDLPCLRSGSGAGFSRSDGWTRTQPDFSC